MRPRQPVPRQWLMTDERADLFGALDRLPAGSGVVFRHHRLEPEERRRQFDRVRAVADEKALLLLLAGSAQTAESWGADGSHGRGRVNGPGLRSAPVHSWTEIRAAERAGANLLFLSPVYPTSSHPEARLLGLARFAWLARRTTLPVIALGGMNEARGRRLASFGAHGWAGIDAWT